MKEWYAGRVVTGKEYDAKKSLKEVYQDIEIYIPRKLITDLVNGKITQKTEKLLHGYILIGSDHPINTDLCKTFFRIIGKVTEEEIENLKKNEYTEENAAIISGVRVIVTDGPFAGCKGTVRWKNGELAQCRFIFHNIEVDTNIGLSYLNTIG